MKILALETTEPIGSIAAARDGDILAEQELPSDRRTAATLAPEIAQLLQKLNWRPDQLDLVAVCLGPGSFTGLRLGITTAKVLAYAVGGQVLAVDTMEVIAAGAPPSWNEFWVVMDAQRRQLFVGRFQRGSGGVPQRCRPTEIVPARQWIEQLPQGTCLTGPGLASIADAVSETTSMLAPGDTRSPAAGNLARIAKWRYDAGQRDDLWKLTPEYVRSSAAEERRLQDLGG